jgi:hypothetical protein
LVNGSVHGPVHGSDIGSDPNLDSDLGFSITFGSDQWDPLPVVSSPGLSVQDISLGNDDYLVHRELGFATAMRGDRASDFKPVSPVHAGNHPSDPLTSALPLSVDSSEVKVVSVPLPSPTFTSDASVDSGLKKSQKWLIESFREVVKGDVTHMAILKDLESSRKAIKEDHELLSPEEDRDLATTKEEIERFLGGRWLVSALVPPKVTDALV